MSKVRGEWEIRSYRSGLCDLTYNRRPVLLSVAEDQAWTRIRRDLEPGQRVIQVELDGYRMDVTPRRQYR